MLPARAILPILLSSVLPQIYSLSNEHRLEIYQIQLLFPVKHPINRYVSSLRGSQSQNTRSGVIGECDHNKTGSFVSGTCLYIRPTSGSFSCLPYRPRYSFVAVFSSSAHSFASLFFSSSKTARFASALVVSPWSASVSTRSASAM